MIEEAVNFIKRTRKLFLSETKRYNDYNYIGYSRILSIGKKVDKSKITKKESIELLKKDVISINKRLNKIIKVDITDNQRIALISLVYDIGIRALLADPLLIEVNKGNILQSISMFRRYGYYKKKAIYSLIKARREEIKLINS